MGIIEIRAKVLLDSPQISDWENMGKDDRRQ